MERHGDYGYDAPYALVSFATGIDLWSTHDQSGNARDVTLQNASLEGVQDRIDIETGDMRALPFADGVLPRCLESRHPQHQFQRRPRESHCRSVAGAQAGRTSGHCRHSRHRALCATRGTLGATGIARRRLGWRFWYGSPFAGTSLVTASKPERR